MLEVEFAQISDAAVCAKAMRIISAIFVPRRRSRRKRRMAIRAGRWRRGTPSRRSRFGPPLKHAGGLRSKARRILAVVNAIAGSYCEYARFRGWSGVAEKALEWLRPSLLRAAPRPRGCRSRWRFPLLHRAAGRHCIAYKRYTVANEHVRLGLFQDECGGRDTPHLEPLSGDGAFVNVDVEVIRCFRVTFWFSAPMGCTDRFRRWILCFPRRGRGPELCGAETCRLANERDGGDKVSAQRSAKLE